MDMSTDVGPLARNDIFYTVKKQYLDALSKGARSIASKKTHQQGLLHHVDFLENIPAEALVHRNEVFGPVGAVYYYEDLDALISQVNDTPYGLGCSLWTKDLAVKQKCIDDIQVGSIAINDSVKSNVAIPFGGTKKSGYGRELGKQGILAFTNPKSVVE